MPATEPTLPAAIDYSVAPAYLRTVNCANAAAFTTALADAQFGDKIVLTAGVTYTGEFTLKVPTGTLAGTGGDNWVTIISSAYASLPAAGNQVTIGDVNNMPTLVATNTSFGNYAISTSVNTVHHYRFVGLNFTTPNFTSAGGASGTGVGGIVYLAAQDPTAEANYPHHISFERCIVKPQYDYGTSFAIQVHGFHFQVIDCLFDEIKRNGDGEAKAIYSDFCSRYIKIYNNYIAACGSSVFFGGSVSGGVPITAGYEYVVVRDVTIQRNTFIRKLQWKRDEATYVPQCDLSGSGTVSSSGTTLTFSTSQDGALSVGKYVKGLTSGAIVKIDSGSGTSWVATTTPSPAFSGESFRYNLANTTAKNMLEFKSCRRGLVDGNTFQNMWNDGQYFDITITPRSYGWIEDMTITNNYHLNTTGPCNLSVGDDQAGDQLGPTPYPTKRFRYSNNLIVGLCSSPLASLGANSYQWSISPFAGLYGWMHGYSGSTITAGATTGTGVTFTASTTVFNSTHVGLVLAYLNGRATITAVAGNKLSCTADITVAFADTSAHDCNLWYMGPASLVKTSYFHGDSWILEHNSIVGSTCAHVFLPGILTNPDASTLMTNFVFRNNLMNSGPTTATNGGGFHSDGGVFGTSAITYFADSSRVVTKNVYFGPNAASGFNIGSHYSASEFLGFHDPDETGSIAGGSVGFVDYAGGNYRVTGTYATAATDGTMVGVNMDTLNAALAGATNTPRYLPIRWP